MCYMTHMCHLVLIAAAAIIIIIIITNITHYGASGYAVVCNPLLG
jgi:hypothetical protein